MAFNSNEFAWKDISVVFLGKTVTAIQGIKYKVSKEKEHFYGRGSKPLGIQSGNEKYEGTLTLLQSEVETLTKAIQAINSKYNLTDISFDIPIVYGSGTKAVTDIIKAVEITEYEKGMEQNDKFMKIELPFVAVDIEYNV